MRIRPILLDSEPSYLRGHGAPSLLRVSLGTETVLDYWRRRLAPLTSLPITVISPVGVDAAAYSAGLAETRPMMPRVVEPDAFADLLAEFDLSDSVLIIDTRWLPVDSGELSDLVDRHVADPRLSHHMVAYDTGVGGTRERVNFDSAGRIRVIQRHYEPATWPFISGVSGTLLPVASAVVGERLVPCGLAALRKELATRGVPSRDVPIRAGAFKLSEVAGLLAANEQLALASTGGLGDSVTPQQIRCGEGHVVHPTVRIVGPVVLHDNVAIEENAMVIGPAVIGAGARISAEAVVAHAVVGAGTVVPARERIQDRVWFGPDAERPVSSPERRSFSYADWMSRLAVESRVAVEPPVGRSSPGYMRVKRLLDAMAAGAALLALSPLLGLIALLIWLKRDGPVFYGDEREGMNGRVFRCWKFRTMRADADAAQTTLWTRAQVDGPHFKMKSDPRVTRIGKLLRASNLDELPQLFNVLVGEMSLVGPRPSPFRENQICVPWRRARISVRPGITGMWQVCRHNRDAGDFHQWIEYDLLYVQHLSAGLDARILAATLLTLGGKATHIRPASLVSVQKHTERLAA